MKIRSVNFRAYNFNFATPFATAKNIFKTRDSLIIEVLFENNQLIIGEAAPLQGFSKETVKEVISNLKNIIPSLLNLNTDNSPSFILETVNSLCKYPSLNFALQSIFLRFYLLNNHPLFFNPVANKIKVNAILSLSEPDVLQKTDLLIKQGYKTIKYKIGFLDFNKEIEILNNIYKNYKNNIKIRLDPNGTFPTEMIEEYFNKFTQIDFEYIEDPINNLSDYRFLQSYIDKIAIDSFNFSLNDIDELIQNYNIKTFIIKPTILGDVYKIIDLLTNDKYKNINFIISSSFESYYSLPSLFYLASLRQNYAHGLNTFTLLDERNDEFLFKDGYCFINTNFTKYNKNITYNFFNYSPSIFIEHFNNHLSADKLINNIDFNSIKIPCNSFISLYNLPIQNLNNLILNTWKNNSTPIVIDPKINYEQALNLANTFKSNLFVSNKKIIPIDNSPKNISEPELILFTSGSTNLPKAVIIPLTSIINSANKFINYFNVTSDDIFLASLPVNHIGGLMIMFRAILANAKVVIPKSTNYLDLKTCIEKYNISYISLVPKQLSDLLTTNIDLTKIKAVILGGAKADDNLVKEALNRGIKLYKVYGSTETCSMVSIASPNELLVNPKSSGKPFQNVEILINYNNRLIKNANVKGEIVVKTDTLFRNYLNNALLEYGDNKKEGYFYTNDIGFINEAEELIIEERKDDIIISGGENISPEEIRTALSEIDFISDAVILSKPDKTWGQVPVAFIVCKKEIVETEIKEILKTKLASYKIPKEIYFIKSIPYNNNGKIDTTKLKEYLK